MIDSMTRLSGDLISIDNLQSILPPSHRFLTELTILRLA